PLGGHAPQLKEEVSMLRALVLAFAIAAIPPARAETQDVVVQKTGVSYRDLDLSKRADATTMLARIERAARHACGDNPLVLPHYDEAPAAVTKEFKRCVRDAVRRAVADLDAPLVTLAYDGNEGPAFASR